MWRSGASDSFDKLEPYIRQGLFGLLSEFLLIVEAYKQRSPLLESYYQLLIFIQHQHQHEQGTSRRCPGGAQ